MRNGYYLSIYTHIDELAAQTDVGVRHDQNMSLWRLDNHDLVLVRFWEFERLSGVKHHPLSFPSTERAIGFINEQLAALGLHYDELVAVVGTPQLGGTPGTHLPDAKLAYHNVCHLYSGLLMDTKIFYEQKILALALDGGPDAVLDPGCRSKAYYTGAWVDKGRMQTFTVASPAVLWALMRQHLSMPEGSLMALGSASTCEYTGSVQTSPRLRSISDIPLVADWFDRLVDRIWSLQPADENVLFRNPDKSFSFEENRISMLVKIIQRESVDIVSETIEDACQRFDIVPAESWLSITGGYALNCPGNSAVMKEFGFAGFNSPPGVNDSGMSLGIGLHFFHHHKGAFRFRLEGNALGPDQPAWRDVLSDQGFACHIASITLVSPHEIASDLQNGPVVWVDGGSEMGPRALGQRSLLSDPRTLDARDQLNRIKQRQWWRPVAPIVLRERAEDWFRLCYPSPYMLHTFDIQEDKRRCVPAICHLDSSARVQTLEVSDNPRLHALISAFAEQTGVPIICNTSLNDKGEPIVQSAEEALNFALRKGIEVVCINGWRIKLVGHAEYQLATPLPRPGLKWFIPASGAKPPVLTRREAMIYFHNPRLHRYPLDNPGSLLKLKRRIARIDELYGQRADFRFIDIWHSEHQAASPR